MIPTSKKELELAGIEQPDVILFTGDAYVDHPSFGVAIIARVLEAEGLSVAVVPQPNWRDDLRDFKKLGRPRLFFGVGSGCMDSMVNHYTANKRLRSDDAYTPEGRAGYRPDRACKVYCDILKSIYPDVPVIIGGIEASLRRFTHYDYWDDCLLPGILAQTPADLLVYGMGEKPFMEIVRRLKNGEPFENIKDVKQTAYLGTPRKVDIELAPHETCLKSKSAQAANFAVIEQQSNLYEPTAVLGQRVGDKMIVLNPQFPPLTTEEMDYIYDLPYTRQPHPRYKGKRIPAFDMIKYSVTLHRGCFGGCAFCTISAQQGKFISSRSEKSILAEVRKICEDKDFKGYISDLGGPSANMYRIGGKDLELCKKCKRPTCLQPRICPNLDKDMKPLLGIYRKVRELPGVKKAFVGSGIRYDLSTYDYLRELLLHHVSGRLKVAPEHTNAEVLKLMRKPPFECFEAFARQFNEINGKYALREQLIPYFISSHPGCTEEAMAELAVRTKKMNFHLEQVQDFTPTPMTLSTEIYYTGINPYTKQKVYCARTKESKLAQRRFFFWYKPEEKKAIITRLKQLKRGDLVIALYNQ